MIIATRELEYITETGEHIAVLVTLHAPEEDENHWKCRYTPLGRMALRPGQAAEATPSRLWNSASRRSG